MSIVPPGTMLARWQQVATSAPPELPVARAKWLASLQPDVRSKFHVVLQEDSIWKTMASWRASAAQYASAIQLWGRAAELCERDPRPPSREVLDAYAFFFKHGPSLSRYLSHIRSALRLLEAPVGVLAETAGMIRGAMKLSVGSVRFKPRADAQQTRALVNCARKDFGRSDIADSWDSCTPLLFAIWCGSGAHADGGKSLSGARRGGEECTPSGYVDSVPSKDAQFSGYCGASLHLQAAGTNIMRRLRSQDSSGEHSLVSSCVVHGRPCVPEGSGNASET